MAKDGVKIDGLNVLLKRFDYLPTAIKKKHLRPAVSDGMQPILATARRSAPVRKHPGLPVLKGQKPPGGYLKKALGKKIKAYKNGNVVGIVGARRGVSKTQGIEPANYHHLVEDGAKPHQIKGRMAFRMPTGNIRPTQLKNGNYSLHRLGLDGRYVATVVHHPGTKATHFLRNAYEAKRAEAVAIAERRLGSGLAREVLSGLVN